MPMTDDKASLDRRWFLKYAATGAMAVAVPNSMHAQEHDHDHDHYHDHQVVPSDPALRTKALESLLVEKGSIRARPKVGPHFGTSSAALYIASVRSARRFYGSLATTEREDLAGVFQGIP
jgi:hypothetical protein